MGSGEEGGGSDLSRTRVCAAFGRAIKTTEKTRRRERAGSGRVWTVSSDEEKFQLCQASQGRVCFAQQKLNNKNISNYRVAEFEFEKKKKSPYFQVMHAHLADMQTQNKRETFDMCQWARFLFSLPFSHRSGQTQTARQGHAGRGGVIGPTAYLARALFFCRGIGIWFLSCSQGSGWERYWMRQTRRIPLLCSICARSKICLEGKLQKACRECENKIHQLDSADAFPQRLF